MSIETALGRSYESGLGSKLVNLVVGIAVSVGIAFAITKFGVANIANVRNDTVLIVVFFALVAVGVVITVRAFINAPVRIVVTPATVEVFKGRTLRHTLPRNEYRFGSFVTRQASSKQVTERRLIATSATQRLEIVCPGFSDATFDDLVAELSPLSPSPTPATTPDVAPALAAPATTGPRGGVYALEPQTRVPGLLVGLGILIVVALAVLTGLISLMIAEPLDSESLGSALVVCGLVIAALGVPIVMVIVRLVRVLNIPRRIEVSSAGLVVDERLFPSGQLKQVSLTPDSYSGMNKRLTIVESNGTRTRYLLETGGGLFVRKPVFAQYAQFALEVARCLPAGLVRYELS